PTPHWVGGTPNPTWAGPYQQCHQTTAAYGAVVAQARKARFTNLACTGSTYVDGITGPWSFPPSPTAPAQFGDWATKTNLNTGYPNPLPAANANISFTACPDAAHLGAPQIAFLSSLLQLQLRTLQGAVGGMKGVAVADVTGVLAGHQWCSADPWAYGASVLALNLQSQAPVHPTAQGQHAVAQVVLKAIPSNPNGG